MLNDLRENLFLEAYTAANFDEPHLFDTDNQIFSSTNSYTRVNTTVGVPYAYYSGGTTIKIRQNFGNSFGYCGFVKLPSSNATLNLGSYNEKGVQTVRGVQTYVTNQSEDYFFLVDIEYNSSSNAYTTTLNIYSTSQNKWIFTGNTNNMSMPNGYDTGSVSDYCPGFIFSTTSPIYVYKFRGYGYKIGKTNAEDLVQGKVIYIKSTKTLMASCFNEYNCTDYANGGHNYTHTCFSKKGGVCCSNGFDETDTINRGMTRGQWVDYDNFVEY